jgi:hypothetical protein
MKTYPKILKEVIEKNPSIALKDAQKLASTIYREQKEANDKLSNPVSGVIPPIKNVSFGSAINPDEVEKAIREAGVDKHNIQVIARRYSPNFQFKIAGKDGVNSLVYLNGPCKVPRNGYFKVWI